MRPTGGSPRGGQRHRKRNIRVRGRLPPRQRQLRCGRRMAAQRVAACAGDAHRPRARRRCCRVMRCGHDARARPSRRRARPARVGAAGRGRSDWRVVRCRRGRDRAGHRQLSIRDRFTHSRAGAVADRKKARDALPHRAVHPLESVGFRSRCSRCSRPSSSGSSTSLVSIYARRLRSVGCRSSVWSRWRRPHSTTSSFFIARSSRSVLPSSSSCSQRATARRWCSTSTMRYSCRA
jgi:hypothetical protein